MKNERTFKAGSHCIVSATRESNNAIETLKIQRQHTNTHNRTAPLMKIYNFSHQKPMFGQIYKPKCFALHSLAHARQFGQQHAIHFDKIQNKFHQRNLFIAEP